MRSRIHSVKPRSERATSLAVILLLLSVCVLVLGQAPRAASVAAPEPAQRSHAGAIWAR